MRASVALAISFASAAEAATRSVTAVVPPPRSLDTDARPTPGWEVVWGLVALPATTALRLGSQARTLTVCGCWTPEMRGRKDRSSCCQVSVSGPPAALFAGREY